MTSTHTPVSVISDSSLEPPHSSTWDAWLDNTGYAKHSFGLSSYAGQTITLKFTGHEDGEFQTSFVVDDTAVSVN